MAHWAPGARVAPQVVVCEKEAAPGPERPMPFPAPLSERAALPVLVSVTVCGGAVSAGDATKLSAAGARVTAGTAPTPVSATFCGEPEAGHQDTGNARAGTHRLEGDGDGAVGAGGQAGAAGVGLREGERVRPVDGDSLARAAEAERRGAGVLERDGLGGRRATHRCGGKGERRRNETDCRRGCLGKGAKQAGKGYGQERVEFMRQSNRALRVRVPFSGARLVRSFRDQVIHKPADSSRGSVIARDDGPPRLSHHLYHVRIAAAAGSAGKLRQFSQRGSKASELPARAAVRAGS